MRLSTRSIVFCLILTSNLGHAAIFGKDTRIAVDGSFAKLKLARATAIAVLSTLPEASSPGFMKLDYVESLSSEVCSNERFSQDPSISYSCTGFLVAPDLIVTAGHCMVNVGESHNETDKYCKAFTWLFDYHNTTPYGSVDLNAIPSNDFYHCKQVIYAVRDEKAPFRDYALVQLDRPVLDRTPLKLSEGGIRDDDQLSMIGYPFGTPAKYSSGARVLLDNPERQSFITNLDAFEGNSGSPVFNAADEVVGILVAGTPSQSFVHDEAGNCDRYNHCDENGENCVLPDSDPSIFPEFQRTGSEVQRIAPVIELIHRFENSEKH